MEYIKLVLISRECSRCNKHSCKNCIENMIEEECGCIVCKDEDCKHFHWKRCAILDKNMKKRLINNFNYFL